MATVPLRPGVSGPADVILLRPPSRIHGCHAQYAVSGVPGAIICDIQHRHVQPEKQKYSSLVLRECRSITMFKKDLKSFLFHHYMFSV